MKVRKNVGAYLLELGADPEAPDANGTSARDLAVEIGHEDVLEIFRSHTGSAIFTKASSFQGRKEGFVFKKGDLGLGYYRELSLATPSKLDIST